MNDNRSYPQLQMVWPEELLNASPNIQLQPGYILRTYQTGDESRFYKIMELAGWPGWDAEKLRPWLFRILPEGWFMAVHARTLGNIIRIRAKMCFTASKSVKLPGL